MVDGQPERVSLSEIRDQIDLSAATDALGTTLSAADARRAAIRRLIAQPRLVVLAIVLAVGPIVVLVREGIHAGLFGVVMFTLAGLALLALYLGLHWPAVPAPAFAALPPAGTRVRVSRDGLTVADRTAPWDAVHLYAAGLRRRGRYVTTYVIEHLKLAAGGETIVLSAGAVTNGQQIVDTIFERLCPAPE